jgi:iron(III) transport system substrate-binding protein
VPQTWADLLNPVYKGEIQVANPASSGTAYTMVATLVQLMGEDKAFDYMKALHKNISQYTRSGTGPIKAVARGETTCRSASCTTARARMQGFPVATITPAEGTGAEIGSMSIIKGARNLDNAKKFYEWALTAPGAGDGRGGQAVPAAVEQVGQGRPARARLQEDQVHQLRLRQVRRQRRAQAADRKWEKDVNSLPR